MNNEITSRTVYTTCDGIEFTHLELAEHHIRTCNVLMNCLLAKPKSEHYHTIWELLKHHQIIDRHDAEYYLQENASSVDAVIEDQEYFNPPSIEKIRKILG